MPYILFVVFDFITHKQLYSSNHFTGSSTIVPVILKIIGIINTILVYGLLILIGATISVWKSFLLLTVAEVSKYILNRVISKRVTKKMTKQGWNINGDEKDPEGTMFYSLYNHKCDVEATKIALIGTLVNLVIIILYFTA